MSKMAASMGSVARNRLQIIQLRSSTRENFCTKKSSSSLMTSYSLPARLMRCLTYSPLAGFVRSQYLSGAITRSLQVYNMKFNTHSHRQQSTIFSCISSVFIIQGYGTFREKKFEKSSAPIGLCAPLAWLFFKKKEEEETIELFVARATVAEQKGHMDKAEDFYHQALKLCHEQQRLDKATYIYDLMANFYLRIHKHLKAEQLFKETIKQLLQAGFKQHDPAVIEISIKLASMYEMQCRHTEAEAGFRFCVSQAEEGLKAFVERQKQVEPDTTREQLPGEPPGEGDSPREEEMNLYATLGLSLNTLGKFLRGRGNLVEAEAAYLWAIEICENQLAVEGRPHAQLPILLNDLGTVYAQKDDYTKAMEVVCHAEVLARDSPADLPVILCNKATIHLRKGERGEATALFRRALRLAETSQDEETIMFVRRAMAQLAATRKKDQGKTV